MRRWAVVACAVATLGAAPATPAPTDADCPALPTAQTARAFRPGEELEYQLDALGAKAGKLVIRVLAPREGLWPIDARAETNPFFSKLRRVRGQATTLLDPVSMRPGHYSEESDENGVHRTADVSYLPEEHGVHVRFTIADKEGEARYRFAHDVLDSLSTVYALRQLPLSQGQTLCMDVYGIRRLWRLSGRVLQREHLSIELGEFDAWHVSGEAVRLDDASQRREVHIWISDDPRRLPLVVLGALDVGVVRATLQAFRRPGEKPRRAEPKSSLKW